MDNDSPSFESFVINSILINNQFQITAVNKIESIKSTYFDKGYYLKVELLLREKNIDGIIKLPLNQTNSMEYLDVMIFYDQKEKAYAVTVYDSLELTQDPQVIDIFSLNEKA